jgi:predicted molibdopterin-dependent oxidoreductase YjgC
MAQVNLTINDNKIAAAQGRTILDVAEENGIFIPHLCHDPRLKPYGACRVCLVEVEGARGPVPSCATPVAEGMVVKTDTVALYEIRKTIVELLLANHPTECLTCQSAGNCALQDLAYMFGIEELRFNGERKKQTIEDYNPVIERDHRKCILCGRCVRICDEVMGIRVWGFVNRGFDAVVTTPYEQSLFDTKCVFCGQCVSTCPTGALTEKLSKYRGRIWETEQTQTVCPYCGVGCQITLHTKNHEVVGVTSKAGTGVNNGNLCVKGRFGYGFVNHPDRLKSPLIRKRGKLVEASWDEAIEQVAKNFSKIKKKHGSDSIAGLSSAKCTNEENYLMQKFMRAVIGTNNVDHCARL